MKKKMMIATILLGMIITACGSKNANSLESSDYVSMATESEETLEQEDTSKNDEDIASSEESTDIETSETKSVKTQKIELDTTENTLSEAIKDPVEEGCTLASFVVDLDKDGKEEAFVIEGYEGVPDNPDYDNSVALLFSSTNHAL